MGGQAVEGRLIRGACRKRPGKVMTSGTWVAAVKEAKMDLKDVYSFIHHIFM